MSPDQARLDATQRWLLGALLAPDSVSPQAIADSLLPGPQLDATACLSIYQRSYILRLRLCLAEQFPATRHALGNALFDDFADDYLRACPSNSYTLYELGRRFSSWLEQTRPDRELPEQQREDWIDFMVDLAHYEHELSRLFDAPGHEGKPWPDARSADDTLVLQPCLALAEYRYPVASYYHAVRAGRSPAFPRRSPAHLVILRRDYQTASYPVSPAHYRFLTALQRLGSVERALADVAAWTRYPLAAVTNSWTTEVRRPWLEAAFFVARE